MHETVAVNFWNQLGLVSLPVPMAASGKLITTSNVSISLPVAERGNRNLMAGIELRIQPVPVRFNLPAKKSADFVDKSLSICPRLKRQVMLLLWP